MKNLFLVFAAVLSSCALFAQTNIITTNPVAGQVMLGNYNPATYMAGTILNDPDTISKGINLRVSADSLKKYMEKLMTFGNRNSGSDTLSSTRGIGAARRWVYSKFQEWSVASGNRLIPSYLQWDQAFCGAAQHRNMMAVLPGMDTTDKSIIIIEGHIDSRCEGSCDTACVALGMEDNASGTALVMELARVMSKYSFNHTIVFTTVIGEEQGLHGGRALATYCTQKKIPILAVQNNDVIGGVICGKTSSPPSCSPAGSRDSINVRIFSYGTFNSKYKQLARFVKLEYKEQLLPYVSIPMKINIMTPEDRTGRGGDHIPFREQNFTSVRFTSQNENGDANSTAPGYKDRQHSTRDSLGWDTNGDMVIDSFFVDFNYLKRNAIINGNALGMAAIGPKTPDFTVVNSTGTKVVITITQQTQYTKYRVGVRTLTNDWDSVYTINSILDSIDIGAPGNHIFSVASVDAKGVESLFSKEIQLALGVGIPELNKQDNISLLQNRPNPFDLGTAISVLVNEQIKYSEACIIVRDVNGREVQRMPITLHNGLNDVVYDHSNGATGVYSYTLMIDGRPVQTRTMVFAN